MFVLFDTAAGYALFKVSDTSKIASVDDVLKTFSSSKSAGEILKLKGFCKFNDTAEALSAAAAVCDGTLDEKLSSFLKETLLAKKKEGDKLKLAVVDKNLGNLIKADLGIKCVYDDTMLELIRGIRQHFNELVAGLSSSESHSMRLGLSHSLARYKLKFSPDKVDTMIIQAIALLDELDKELNTYAMRVKEWYGWHFPEMVKVLNDNLLYAKTIRKVGYRSKMKNTDLSDVLPEELEAAVKEAAEVSMGTEISESDLQNIQELAEQVIKIAEYRASLFEYLKNRMNAIAPNLTVMVGELVGARLVAHAGSLLNLAKHPASTVQILGAEKALFRALKTKHDTPKYGLIYHASLVGQAPAKLKGKISRMLAAKTALSCRMDALGESDSATIGLEGRTKVESRLRQLEGGKSMAAAATPKKPAQDKYHKPTETPKSYNTAADVSVSMTADKKDKKKKEKESAKKETSEDDMVIEEDASEKKKKKKEKRKAEEEAVAPAEDDESEKKKKKKEKKAKKAKKESEDSD